MFFSLFKYFIIFALVFLLVFVLLNSVFKKYWVDKNEIIKISLFISVIFLFVIMFLDNENRKKMKMERFDEENKGEEVVKEIEKKEEGEVIEEKKKEDEYEIKLNDGSSDPRPSNYVNLITASSNFITSDKNTEALLGDVYHFKNLLEEEKQKNNEIHRVLRNYMAKTGYKGQLDDPLETIEESINGGNKFDTVDENPFILVSQKKWEKSKNHIYSSGCKSPVIIGGSNDYMNVEKLYNKNEMKKEEEEKIESPQ